MKILEQNLHIKILGLSLSKDFHLGIDGKHEATPLVCPETIYAPILAMDDLSTRGHLCALLSWCILWLQRW